MIFKIFCFPKMKISFNSAKRTLLCALLVGVISLIMTLSQVISDNRFYVYSNSLKSVDVVPMLDVVHQFVYFEYQSINDILVIINMVIALGVCVWAEQDPLRPIRRFMVLCSILFFSFNFDFSNYNDPFWSRLYIFSRFLCSICHFSTNFSWRRTIPYIPLLKLWMLGQLIFEIFLLISFYLIILFQLGLIYFNIAC